MRVLLDTNVLVRLFAERHGGSLTITSEPGRGAIVRLDLPMEAGA